MVTDARIRAYPCSTCNALAGARCKIRGQTSDAHHAARLERHKHEEAGPVDGEPAYFNGVKRRVRGRQVVAGRTLITLRESYGPAVDVVDRSRMSWDSGAGLWRVA